MSLQFDFHAGLTAEKFIAKPGNKASTQLVSRQYSLKTYYDSFDWRLSGLFCSGKHPKTIQRKNAEQQQSCQHAFCHGVINPETGYSQMQSPHRFFTKICCLQAETYLRSNRC